MFWLVKSVTKYGIYIKIIGKDTLWESCEDAILSSFWFADYEEDKIRFLLVPWWFDYWSFTLIEGFGYGTIMMPCFFDLNEFLSEIIWGELTKLLEDFLIFETCLE